ncbi:MAG: hypothetical protein MJZ20_11020 [Bacteroidaceae bacterium]|nr:hypothetical protein [Bacteroidaceae bacterium]
MKKSVTYFVVLLAVVCLFSNCKKNEDVEMDNTITVYGNVIDRTTGLPLYNVLIQEKNKVGGSTVTGNDGNYEFTLPLNGSSSGNYYIVASKDKYSTSEYELNMSQVDKNRRVKVDFQLTSESIFYTGVVVDSKNQPIVDAKISATFKWGSNNIYNIGTTAITTIDGSYTLELPRPHEYNESSRKALDQWPFTITASKDGYANTQHVLNQSADDMGKIITLNFIMKTDQEQLDANSVTIFGTVTNTTGQPIANAEIVDYVDYDGYSLYYTLSTVQTDSKGSYELISPTDGKPNSSYYYRYHSYVCRAEGYKSVTKTLYTSDIDKGKSYNFNFVLTKN